MKIVGYGEDHQLHAVVGQQLLRAMVGGQALFPRLLRRFRPDVERPCDPQLRTRSQMVDKCQAAHPAKADDRRTMYMPVHAFPS